MNVLPHHYPQLAGLNSHCTIPHVASDARSHILTLSLDFVGTRVVYQNCGTEYANNDHLDVRRWCGVKRFSALWVDKPSRFTLLFEAFAIHALQATQSIQAAALPPRIEWPTAQAFLWRAVKRGFDRRSLNEVRHAEIGEKSFGVAQDYASGMTWSLKELIRLFWQQIHAGGGRAFFEPWYAWVICSRFDPTKKVTSILRNRLDRIRTWLASPISNGVAEELNIRILSRCNNFSLNTTEY